MKKRTFLKLIASAGTGGILLSGNAIPSFGNNQTSRNNQDKKFALPDLPYAYDALVPHIDAETMRIHHSKHFQGYVDKLNKAVDGTSYEGKTIENILAGIKSSDAAIRNNGGGYYNHKLFFESLSPSPKSNPEGKLNDAIKSSFGSFQDFQKELSTAATGVFGSGWAWLVRDSKGKLSIITSPNQDNSLMSFSQEKGFPLMGIDVWEHAYYLKYQNKRSDYVDAFWKVLDWNFVEKRF